MRNLLLLSGTVVFLFFSCAENEQTKAKSGVPVDTTSEQVNVEEAVNMGNLFEFKGTINGMSNIFIQYRKNWADDIYGVYVTEDNSLFKLKGIIKGNEVSLFKEEDGVTADEIFVFEIPEYTTTQTIEGAIFQQTRKKPLSLQYIQSKKHTPSFLYAVKELINNDKIKNERADYSIIHKLKLNEGNIEGGSGLKLNYNGDKILFFDHHESKASGHDDLAIFAYLPTESMSVVNNDNNVLFLELKNSWENNTKVQKINKKYESYITVYNLKNGEQNEIQSIRLEGKGYAQVYYINEKLFVQSGDREDIFYYNKKSGHFDEH